MKRLLRTKRGDLALQPNEIYRSLIRLYILLAAAKGSIDGNGVMERLGDRGLTMNHASVQRILRKLETEGYLKSNEGHTSRSRRRYTATRAGRLRLKDAKKRIRVLIEIFGPAGVS